MLSKMGLATKLIGGFVIIVVLIVVCGGVAYFGTSRLKSEEDVSNQRLNDAIVCNDAQQWAVTQYRYQADMIINRNPDAFKDFEAANKEFVKNMDILKGKADTAEEKAWIEEIGKNDDAYDRLLNDKILPLIKKSAANVSSEEEAAIAQQLKDYDAESDKYLAATLDTLEKFTVSLQKEADESGKAFDATYMSINIVVIVVSVISIIAGLLLGILLTRSISVPLNRVIDGMTAGAEQTSSAAGQVSSASQSLAEGSAEQASSLEEVSSSLEEMASMTRQNADNAEQANKLAKEARAASENGNVETRRMIEAMDKISASAGQTQKIIKTIDEIAFQTNLLALNAAVEAARAGEAGKGFAVVAEEVRNLAQRAGEAARNTATLIEESVANTTGGTQIAGAMAKSLEEITGSSVKVSNLVAEIAAASREQAQGIEQVNVAIGQMDKVTQANASNAEESASAAEEMSSQAETMKGMVLELVAMVGGAAASAGTAARGYAGNGSSHLSHQHFGLHNEKEELKKKVFINQHKVIQGATKSGNGASAKTAGATSRKPEELIPLHDSDDFKEF